MLTIGKVSKLALARVDLNPRTLKGQKGIVIYKSQGHFKQSNKGHSLPHQTKPNPQKVFYPESDSWKCLQWQK